MQELEVSELKKAIKKNYPYMDEKLCKFHAERIMQETDKRLYENIIQWVCGEKLNEKLIGDYCIEKIMQIRGNRDFLSALDAMDKYLKDKIIGEAIIWRTRR